jgi:hypothetical protein
MEEPPDRFLCTTLYQGAEGFLPALRIHSKVECYPTIPRKNAASLKPYAKATHVASIFIGILQIYHYPKTGKIHFG